MTTLSLKMRLQTTRYCHWPTQSATSVRKMRMYRRKRLLSKGGGIKNGLGSIGRDPFTRPMARALISRSGPTGWRGLLPKRPKLKIKSKWHDPLAVFDAPLRKASFSHQFFTLLHLSPRTEEARSAVGRLAGQTHCRKPIKKRQHSRKNRMQKPPCYFCRAQLRT